MAGRQPNIVAFFWDNFGWGELGCYGGGVLPGAPRTAYQVLRTTLSYFPNGTVTAAPCAGAMQIPLEPEPIDAAKPSEPVRSCAGGCVTQGLAGS